MRKNYDDRNFVWELIKTWVIAFFAYGLGKAFLGEDSGAEALIVACIPFGLTFFNKVVRFNLFGNSNAVIFFWIIKIFLSSIIGVIAFPIVNLYYIIKIISRVAAKRKQKTYENFE